MATTPTPQPTPTPTPGPAMTNKTFWEYIKADVGNHIKLVSILVGILLAVIAYNYVRDLQKWKANQEKVNDTLAQKYQQVGNNAVSGNTQASQQSVDQSALAAFGQQVTAIMAAQNAKISSLTTAYGLISAQQTALSQQKQTTFTPQEQTQQTGALTGYALEESRKAGPPLTSVNLFYDPTQRDPNKAFGGTTWTHYQEQFTANFGDWVKQKDGSYRNSVSLNRTVSKPDPNDPTRLIQIGTEAIPITGANTVYSPKGLLDPSAFTVPRWTLSVGLADNKNGKTGYGTIDYRVTDRFGLFAGTADNGLVGGISIRLDARKKQ